MMPNSTLLAKHSRPGRVKALITLLEAGIPAEKLFRSAMEAAFKVSLTSPSHLLEFVPAVQELQKKELSEEILGRYYTGILMALWRWQKFL